MALKRASSGSPGGSPGKRGRIVDPVVRKSGGIEKVLAASRELDNPHLAKLLAGLVPQVLRTPKEERHAFQAEAADMIGNALQTIESAIGKHIVEYQSKSNGADGERRARIAARAEAEKALSSLREAVAGAEKVVDEDNAAVATARSALNKAMAAQRSGDHDFDEAEAKKQEIESALTESFVPLKEMGAQGSLGKAGIKTLQKVAQQIKVENALLKGFPPVLAKSPAERSSFDNVMVKQLEDELAASVAALHRTLEEGRPGKAERAATADAAKNIHNAAVAKHNESKAAHKHASEACMNGQSTLKETGKKVSNFFKDMKALMDDLDASKNRLAAFREGPLTDYAGLKELVKEAEPAPAAEEEAAVEVAPEGAAVGEAEPAPASVA